MLDPTAVAGAVSAQTIEAVRAALTGGASPEAMAKAVTTQGFSTTTGLVGINLEAPAKNLFPVLSPLRNRFPRKAAAHGATAVQWRAITAINANKLKAGVAEGVRNSGVSTTEADFSATYKDFGLDDSVTFRAQDAAEGFMDIRAEAAANLLAAVMVEEEKIILGGNVTAIGKPASITAADTAAAATGSLVASTQYDYAVSALTLYGYVNGANGHGSADSSDETDGRTGTHTTTGSGAGSDAIVLSWPAVRGAVAYNIFAAAHSGTLKYVATVTATKYTLTAIPGSGNAANSADQTADALSFGGLISQVEASAGNGYFKDLLGAGLTGDNAGGVVEIDALLKSLWDNARIGPTALIVNSQEAQSITQKILANGSTTTLRWQQGVGPDGSVTGGLVADSYLNKFTSPRSIPILIHPYLAPGTVIAISERLPFPRNNVGAPWEIDVQREYTQYDWALVQRKWEFGVYGAEVLKGYFPAGCGTLVGIA